MSYDKETAGKPLEGSEFDECILNEREQRHILVDDYHGMPGDEYIELRDAYIEAVKKIARQQQWINDLQSGMYVNCVYCGHRYGPADEVPASMADVLKQHIEQCPEHPMSKLKAELEEYHDKKKHGVYLDAVEAAKVAILTQKLADGQLVELPYKVGSTVWILSENEVVECVMDDAIRFKAVKYNLEIMRRFDGKIREQQTVFLTREAAEAALAKQKEPEHE